MNKRSGFAIVEILIIIAVVGVLVYIINSNNSSVPTKKSIDNSLVIVTLQSELSNITNRLRLDQASSNDGSYPNTLELANGGAGIVKRPDITYKYIPNNTTNPKTFCVTVTQNDISYMATNSTTPAAGACPDTAQ